MAPVPIKPVEENRLKNKTNFLCKCREAQKRAQELVDLTAKKGKYTIR